MKLSHLNRSICEMTRRITGSKCDSTSEIKTVL